jgi:16S rRNA (guanine1207-N2)-methyltransferase
MSDTLRALLTPFATGMLPMPGKGEAVLLRAEDDPALWRDLLVCEQTFKPAFDALDKRGFTVTTEATGPFRLALVPATKHKAETLANLARAWDMLEEGGTLVFVGGNDLGGGTLAKELRKAAGEAGSLSKHHCKVVWTTRQGPLPDKLAVWLQAGQPRHVAATGCLSRPGLYNWDKVDKGSALLVGALPENITGRVADLGAGWGYIAAQLMDRPGIALDLFEAERLALDCARINVPGAQYHWCDVAAGIPARSFDWVVSNPPFHSGKATDIALGQAFIAAAAAGLKPGGRLVLVANRHLPYEPVIDRLFAERQVLAEDNAYKVILAKLA